MKNSLFQIFPFHLSLDIFFADEDKAKSILPDGLMTAIESLCERERTVLFLRYRDGLMLDEEEIISDGWHRFISYVERGLEKVPVLLIKEKMNVICY